VPPIGFGHSTPIPSHEAWREGRHEFKSKQGNASRGHACATEKPDPEAIRCSRTTIWSRTASDTRAGSRSPDVTVRARRRKKPSASSS
jgi:hypothetical protein